MKKNRLQLLFVTAFFSIFAVANCGNIFAQSASDHYYQVFSSAANSDAIVETSISKNLVSVAIRRKNQPTHYYNSYPEVKVSGMKIGKKTIFTVYHKEQRIEAGQFNKKLSELSGSARSQRAEIVPIREKLEDDMNILRAVRAYDKKAGVLLAELAYTIATYDNRAIDAADDSALKNFSVSEIAQSARLYTTTPQ